ANCSVTIHECYCPDGVKRRSRNPLNSRNMCRECNGLVIKSRIGVSLEVHGVDEDARTCKVNETLAIFDNHYPSCPSSCRVWYVWHHKVYLCGAGVDQLG